MHISTIVYKNILLNKVESIGNINEPFTQLHFSF